MALLSACGARTELDAPDARAAIDAAPCATRSVDLAVPSTTEWTDTGVDVSAGTLVTIHATGDVRYGPMAAQHTDANGGNFDGQQFFSSAVFPKAPVCSLIGRVGDSPLPNANGFVGTSYEATMSASGRLFLGFNDQVGQFNDNSGAFQVAITASCP